MEGRYPNGLMVAITSCKDPSKTEEFNNWYNHMHVPDVTEPGIFRNAIRFANTDPASEVGQYVATYETDFEDVSQAMPAHQKAREALKKEGDRSSPWMQSSGAHIFKKLGGEFRAASKPSRGIFLMFTNSKDPAREDEFNRWYEDIHLPEILSTGAFHTVYRYECLDPERLKAKFLAIYETDTADLAQARETMREGMAAQRAEKERLGIVSAPSLVEGVFSLNASRIWPMG